LATLLPLLPTLAQLPVPVVLDHFAGISDVSMASPDAQAILALVASGQAYVKLSAPYRSAAPLAATARALARANPARILWGSDWPHTQREPGRDRLEVSRFQSVDAGRNLRETCDWIDDVAFIEQMLVTNPVRLYGFGVEER
jgi:predicted TIM-barrel fold metal-dependent hydrolase